MTAAIETTTTSEISRRGIFRGAGGLAAVAAVAIPAFATAAPVGSNDAILIRATDELAAVQHAMRTIEGGWAGDGWADDPEYVALDQRETEIFDALAETPPDTIVGFRAIARVMMSDFEDGPGNTAVYDCISTRLAIAIGNHLLGAENGREAMHYADVGASETEGEQFADRVDANNTALGNDMRLVALADEYEQIQSEWTPLLGPAEDDPAAEAEIGRLQQRNSEIRDAMVELRAMSPVGWRAKGRIALLNGGPLTASDHNWDNSEGYLAASLIEDMLGAHESARIERIQNPEGTEKPEPVDYDTAMAELLAGGACRLPIRCIACPHHLCRQQRRPATVAELLEAQRERLARLAPATA